jgi:hypothetical protein
MLVVALFALDPPELSFKLVNGHIDAPIGVLARFGADENLAVLGLGNDFHTRVTALVAVNDYFDSIDAVIVLRKLGGLFLGVPSNSFGYLDVFAADCKKQIYSP